MLLIYHLWIGYILYIPGSQARFWKNLLYARQPGTILKKTIYVRDSRTRFWNNICDVSFDGTWHRRSHSSLNGWVTAVSDTGKCLGIEIMCNCSARKNSTEDYRLWEADTDISGKCKAIYCSSGTSNGNSRCEKTQNEQKTVSYLLQSIMDRGIEVVKNKVCGTQASMGCIYLNLNNIN